ncbi:hypothetical protein [Cellulomonas sp. ATA003]|uniref:hypothetical protein n=1 Tax=Cellulomonas sp. ATA003 TaxID=3073064 RepID=UPI00287326C6|nr:hypothetical protein [Cellulomonas sp. ATA003]WNB86600.1 hypothetical protein REH70_05035 [Cellulomonas sp. ATA003]
MSALALGGLLALAPTAAVAADPGPELRAHGPGGRSFTPGAAGVGDPYFPLDGNGGYDVRHYDLDVRYDPATDVIVGEATITAHATQDLSAFNLDLSGLAVRSVVVDGRTAAWSRDGDELTVTPQRGLRERSRFRVVVRYDGVPAPIVENLGLSGFMPTDDGALVAGQPHVAATWFPVNDHPTDTASYTIEVAVPEGLEASSNGILRSTRTRDGWTTWRWEAKDPMASYLVTLAMGDFDLSAYRADGVRYWDAVDPALDDAGGPRTGSGRPWRSPPARPSSDSHARSRCRPPVPRCPSGSSGTPSPRSTSSWSRRACPGPTRGPRCRTSTGTPPRTPGSRAPPGSRSTRSSSTTSRPPRTAAARAARPASGGRPRAPAPAPSSGRSTSRRTPAGRSRCR